MQLEINSVKAKSFGLSEVMQRLKMGFIFTYLIAAVIAFIATPILSISWLNHPYLGVFIGNTLVINSSISVKSDSLNAYQLNFSNGYQITAVNGDNIQNARHLNQILERNQRGNEVDLTLSDMENNQVNLIVRLVSMPFADMLIFAFLPYLLGLAFLSLGLWIYALRRRNTSGQAFIIFCTSIALSLGLLFDSWTSNILVYVWLLSLSMVGGSFIYLSFSFPDDTLIQPRWTFLKLLGFLPGLIIFILTLGILFNRNNPFLYPQAVTYNLIYALFGLVIFIGLASYRFLSSPSPSLRDQNRLILISTAISFIPFLLWSGLYPFSNSLEFSPIFFIPTIIFPITMAYNIGRNRFLKTDYIASQVLLYSSLTFIAAVGYGLIISGITLVVGFALDITNPFVIGAAVFMLAFILLPLKERIQTFLNKSFGHNQSSYQENIQSFSHTLTHTMDILALNELLRDYLNTSLDPSHIHIFLNEPDSELYTPLPDSNGNTTSDLVFNADSGLVSILSARRSPVFLGDLRSLPARLFDERVKLGLLNSHIYVPLPGQARLVGWFSCGVRNSGQPYNQNDLTYLETISDQAALAFERCQVMYNLEERGHQMNVLSRITQGINVTSTFDDILELIYAQSNQIIHTLDFRICLLDDRSDNLVYTFFIENDERINTQENKIIPNHQGLERIVLRTGRTAVTDDYQTECRSHDLIPDNPHLLAWIGVPLNTGTDTIGVLSLGSRDPLQHYTLEEANLLQAIADQAAGAIVKARLLEEAERRAQQLASLNEVARSMSSNLELVPLLNQILRSAVDILKCDAGSLLFIDEDTGEYIFEAAVGEVANDLIGTRLPSGTGLVGKAVETKQALIVNDVRRSQDWSNQPDTTTGFKTNDMLVVPMIYREDVIGVIEVLNRNDGMPFSINDQELLTTFASQAAVALENARLFTLTDQTLAERVEELSVLQRIDRELNTSLDVNRAINVTLDWAMRQSQAEAALIGMIEGESLQIMASEGFGNIISVYQSSGLPLEIPTILKAIETGLPQFADQNDNQQRGLKSLLPDALQQIVIPIRREALVIGLILLESRKNRGSGDEKIGFLNRLSDHAAVAITNAQLYTKIQDANQAKTDFISFVSHELKTPMTSIRGFTDLLSSGVVGEMNENQANFLNTIRSNVDRMATLVSDLADVSRIEAGRLRLEFSAISVQEVIDEVVRSTRTQIQDKKQTLTVNVPKDIPDMWGDRIRIIQILTNLVSNAYKYTQPEGTIKVNAELTENIWSENSPQVLHIFVEDNGFGISPENQPMIFQKFYRSEDQKIRDAPGTGLGLNITKQLVELQGGHIWFDSAFRGGTTFHFTVPIAEST